MLTEKGYKDLEEATGIIGLQEIIESEEAKEITLKKTKHFDEISYNQLYDNLTKQGLTPEKYEESKKAGEEMAVKAVKKAKGYEFEGKTVEALNEYLESQIQLKSKTDVSEIEKQYQKDLEQLKKQIQDERTEKEKILSQRKQDKINSQIDNILNSIQIKVPDYLKDEEQIKQYIQREKEKNNIFFKSIYKGDLDENDNLIFKNKQGEVIKDDLLNPISLDSLASKFVAENYIQVEQPRNGRGDGDKFPVNNNLSSIKSIDELKEYAAKQGVKPNTTEFDAMFIEFQKNNENK